MRSVEGRWGKCWFYGKDIYVGGSMFHYGEFSPDETEKIISLASGLCLDIGANFGCISQALEYSGFKVVAFEPQPEIYKMTRMNVRGTVHNCALGSSEGVGTMPKFLYGSKENYGSASIGHRTSLGTINIPIRTLDSFYLDDVGLIKIDVEGYELEVLQGAVDTIARCKPIMYIEDDRPENSKALHACISSLGYSIEEHATPLFREDNFFKNKKYIWDIPLLYSYNLICRPC